MSTSSNFIGEVPKFYDQGLGPVMFNHYATDLSRRVARHQPANVLELAAGTGIVTEALRAALPQPTAITATDLNQPMLAIAEAKLENKNAINFKIVDAQDLPFEPATFNSMACQFGIMFFPNKLLSFQEACRVLKPGGHYVFNVWRSWKENPFAEIAHETIAGFFSGDPPGFYKVPFGYHDANEITSLVRQGGFSAVTSEIVKHRSPLKDIAGFSKALVYGNPIREEVLARGGNPDEVVAALERAMRKEYGSANSTPLEAIVFTAVK